MKAIAGAKFLSDGRSSTAVYQRVYFIDFVSYFAGLAISILASAKTILFGYNSFVKNNFMV